MKSLIYIVAGLMLVFTGISNHRVSAGNPQEPASGNSAATSVKILCTSDMKNLAEIWAGSYNATAPSVEFTITEVTESTITAPGHISLLNAGTASKLNDNTFRKMAVGRDAAVLICHPAHPLSREIAAQGITPEKLAKLITSKTIGGWDNTTAASPVRILISPDNSVADLIGSYTNQDASSIVAVATESREALLNAIRSDINAVGLCRLSDIIDQKNQTFLAGIMIVPVDRNRNGKIDSFENIYASPEAFTRGIWTGKYPAALTENIYAVVSEGTLEASAAGFLAWVNGTGQDNLSQFGYADLSTGEREANLQQLQPVIPVEVESRQASSIPWVKILFGLAVVLILAYSAAVVFRRGKLAATAENFRMSSALNPETIKAPAGLYYDKSHTWAFMEKDGSVRIGIDDFLQHITGPLTRIKMKNSGEKVRKGEKIITLIREGKQLEIYAPVSGTIRQYNEDLLKSSDKLNTSPYTEGWIYTIEPTNWAREIQFLIMGRDYREWLSEEFGRLRDFFALSANNNNLVYQQVVLQDGGEITDNILADMGPEVWEEFQTKFIDTSR